MVPSASHIRHMLVVCVCVLLSLCTSRVNGRPTNDNIRTILDMFVEKQLSKNLNENIETTSQKGNIWGSSGKFLIFIQVMWSRVHTCITTCIFEGYPRC